MANVPPNGPNNPDNAIATFFGICRQGTSRAFDVITTMVAFFVVAVALDAIVAESFKLSMPIVSAAVIFGPAVIVAYWWYARASADNRIRRAVKLAPDTTTVKQIRDAVTVNDVV